MTTLREKVRAARADVLRVAGELGINVDEERKQEGANIKTLTHDATKLINEPVPIVARSRQIIDNPVLGTFNGANTTFTLTFPVSGNEIQVIYGKASAITTTPLTRGASNPPPTNSFYFDGTVNKQTIIVNPAPQVADALMAIYSTDR
jgi:hypothetical protein